MSIEVKNITKVYGKQKALDNVSLSIRSGEIVGLLGPNGAGKSTLMKIIACYLPPNEGDVYVMGHDILEHSLQVRKHVGYLPENNPLYQDLYVKEYLEFIAGLYNLDKIKSRVSDMIGVTGLHKEQNKKIKALSKGYRQRIGLAQALIHDPDVLILDEPTSGLDPNQLVEIRELIRKLGTEKTVILSTHIMQEVEAVCTRAVIIHFGQIIADGNSEELSGYITDFQTVEVEFDKQIAKDILSGIEGITDIKIKSENVWQIVASTDKDIRSLIFKFAVDNDLTVLSMKRTGQSIEDIFRKLTRQPDEKK
ncbi:MAG: gliding motility-associated ABC transporter ATP-binding subunit GldA [Bacteroidales bacterium]|nr:gliding motility-associated ABC transporter ATP-binding subunit GldA [Bacteroidales bacterium]